MVGICNKKKEKRERLYNSFDKKTIRNFKSPNQIVSDSQNVMYIFIVKNQTK